MRDPCLFLPVRAVLYLAGDPASGRARNRVASASFHGSNTDVKLQRVPDRTCHLSFLRPLTELKHSSTLQPGRYRVVAAVRVNPVPTLFAIRRVYLFSGNAKTGPEHWASFIAGKWRQGGRVVEGAFPARALAIAAPPVRIRSLPPRPEASRTRTLTVKQNLYQNSLSRTVICDIFLLDWLGGSQWHETHPASTGARA